MCIRDRNQLKEGRQYGGGYHCAPTATAACLKYFEGQGDDDIAGGLSGDDLTDELAKYEGCNEGGKGTYFGEWVSGIRNWIDDHGGGYTVRSFSNFDWKTARDEAALLDFVRENTTPLFQVVDCPYVLFTITEAKRPSGGGFVVHLLDYRKHVLENVRVRCSGGEELRLLALTPDCDRIIKGPTRDEWIIPRLGVYSILTVER